MPEILMPESVSEHSDVEAVRCLSARDTRSEVKLGILRHLLFHHHVNEVSLHTLALTYSDVDLRLRAAVLATICSAIDRWGMKPSVVDSCERTELLVAIQNEIHAILWPWCLLARAALMDERLAFDVRRLEQAIQAGDLKYLESIHQGQTGQSELTDLVLFKSITAAIRRIENRKRLLAFCY